MTILVGDMEGRLQIKDYLEGDIDENNTIYGLDWNDVLIGGSREDQIYGGNHDDKLYGRDGHDYLDGESGNDWLYGEFGNDRLYGGDGIDSLYGGAGNDFLYGEDGHDFLIGGSGNDVMKGGGGNDTLVFGDGPMGTDWAYGGFGNDSYIITPSSGTVIVRDEGSTYDTDLIHFTSVAIHDIHAVPYDAESDGVFDDMLFYTDQDLADGALDTAVIVIGQFGGDPANRIEYVADSANQAYTLPF